MKNVIVDAGPLIALFDKSDQYHTKVLNWLKHYQGKLITTWPVLTEVVHILDFNPNVPVDFLKWIHLGGVQIIDLHHADLQDMIEIFEKYRDLPSDLADVSLIFIASKMGVREIITIDNDFYVYKTPDGRYLENVLS